jgi:hypothetical protein
MNKFWLWTSWKCFCFVRNNTVPYKEENIHSYLVYSLVKDAYYTRLGNEYWYHILLKFHSLKSLATRYKFDLTRCINRKYVKGKSKAIPVTGREYLQGCERSRLPHFVKTITSQIVVRLSALRVGRPLPSPPPPGRFPGLISVRGWVAPRAIVRLEGLGKLKKSISSELDPATFRLVA